MKKKLDVGLKAILQIEFIGKLKNPDSEIVANESMLVLTILRKIKETLLKHS